MVTNMPATVTLNNGVKMPRFGLGVLHIPDGPDIANAVKWALEYGYRLIDTASIYRNEQGVGEALRASQVPREDVFLTTKVWNSDQGFESTMNAFQSSLDRLGVDVIDLYLIHWPGPDPKRTLETWRALESIYLTGRGRAIGVSNFQIPHLEKLLAEVEIPPMLNQVELHPYLQQTELVNYCREHRIQIEAWRPIMQGQVHEIPTLIELARRYRKNPVQIALRWLLQRDIVVIPKSQDRVRIKDNTDIFDFQLEEGDLARIDALDQGHRLGPDPLTFAEDFG